MLWNENIAVLLFHCMLHVGFRAMHESMTSQKIKKLGAGGQAWWGGQNFWWGGHGPPGPPAGYGPDGVAADSEPTNTTESDTDTDTEN